MHLRIQGFSKMCNEITLFLLDNMKLKVICLNEHKICYDQKLVLNNIRNFKLADSYFRDNSSGG